MFISNLSLFSFLLLLTTAAAQPYKATDLFFLDCGSSNVTTYGGRTWDGDEGSKFTPLDISTTSFSSKPSYQDPSALQIPYNTARIFNGSSFTYAFQVSQGPKFLRLHFYTATYSDLQPNQSFFSISSNGYSLLTNFSPFLASTYVETNHSKTSVIEYDFGYSGYREVTPSPFVSKEFIIYVKDTQTLNVIFTPSPKSYAFINGIEIVSMPEDLYNKSTTLKDLGISDYMAQETVYRLNVGGGNIPGEADTGMYRSWESDDPYIFGAADYWLEHANKTPITYTMETPNYTAPEQVYATQRNMGDLSKLYNLTWILPVDYGFYYVLRLHFCNIIPKYNTSGQMVFKIFINNRTVEEEADPLYWSKGRSHPVFKDYGVFVNDPDGSKSKQDMWLAIHPNIPFSHEYLDGYLNGLEAFKLSTATTRSLASANPELSSTVPLVTQASPNRRNPKKNPSILIKASVGGGTGFVLLLSVLVLVVLWRQRRHKRRGSATNDDKPSWGLTSIELRSTKNGLSSLSSDRCHRFTLKEVKVSTGEFNDNCVIGKGGFGKVYKGYIGNPKTIVAIKRLNPSSNQGLHEFQTEIKMLSKLRHVHLVSLTGFCDEDGEMVLVYDYMAHGTLQEHLYKTKNPPLPWKTRLHICIGAAQGLLYLHTSAKRGIIHRDVKSTNILLDENWVAKVSDFGLSKLGPKGEFDTHVTTLVKGSVGYLDPEYYRRQQLTDKSDVYSFGVVLFEVLCARPVIIPWLPSEQVNLAEWGSYCYQNGTLDEIIDPKLRGEIAPGSLRKFGEVANSCLKEQGSSRPSR